jgi:hypothetical protein
MGCDWSAGKVLVGESLVCSIGGTIGSCCMAHWSVNPS